MGISFNADEIFEMGMDVEKNGEAYYRKCAELSGDPGIRKVFAWLAGEEKSHWETFRRLREELPGGGGNIIDAEGLNGLYLDAIVKSRLFSNIKEAEAAAAGAKDGIEALKAALAFEKDTILFFAEMKAMTRADFGAEKIDMLINEERKHVVGISEEIKKALKKSA
ncbi:MAG: ferritin family protein [Candidatus Krumholzibacteria bacterium]|jgi:rubrerythrin|nr:ferritin family protein [Candidatus Krumholzibacteria bacterium]